MGKRFVITYSQVILGRSGMEVYVDRETGVNYLFVRSSGYGGLTPLLDREGKPVITAVYEEE